MSRNVRKRTFLHAHNEDSDQPAHPRSLIRVFIVRMKELCILGYPKCTQWRFWSDCANAQADSHRLIWIFTGCTCSKVRFLTLRFIWLWWVIWICTVSICPKEAVSYGEGMGLKLMSKDLRLTYTVCLFQMKTTAKNKLHFTSLSVESDNYAALASFH